MPVRLLESRRRARRVLELALLIVLALIVVAGLIVGPATVTVGGDAADSLSVRGGRTAAPASSVATRHTR